MIQSLMTPPQSFSDDLKKTKPVLSDGAVIVRLIKALWCATPKAPWWIGASFLTLAAAKSAALTVPLFYKKALDSLSDLPESAHAVLFIIGSLFFVRLAMVLFGELRDVLFVRVEQRAIRRLSRSVFAHLHSLSMDFHLNRKTGELKRVLERGGRAVENFFRYFVFNLLPTFAELFCIVAIIFYLYTWQFGALILATLAAYIAFTFVVSKWRLVFMRTLNKAANALSTHEVDSLLNAATVKYFVTEEREVKAYDAALGVYEKEALKNRWSLSFLNAGQGIILSIGLVSVMISCIPGLSSGALKITDFVLLNTYIQQVYGPLYILGFAYRELKQALVDMEGFFRLFDENQRIEDAPNAKNFVPGKGTLEVRNLFFSYDKKRPVLKDVSFQVKAGETVALVGSSGSGKSTLASLLLRFFDPDSGQILMDGQPLTELKQKSFRRFIGVVPQDTVLFNNTLTYNVGYGKEGASKSMIVSASQKASLHDFVLKLPKGYDTWVGERGLKLSGGEKQRVGIARALLKDPIIFLFDEATSSLDTQTESLIQKSIEDSSRGRTTVIIAHRLSTVVGADKILVLDQGKIAEQGKHATLLAKKGLYAAMWERQRTAESLEK